MTNLDGIGNLDGMANLKSTKIEKHGQKSTRYMLQNSRACVFLRSPKRRRQLGHRHKGLGDHKIDEHSHKSFILVQ